MTDATRERRLRSGMRWLTAGCLIAVVALISWAIIAVSSGWAGAVVGATSGSVAVIVAWTTGFVAIKTQRQQLAAAARD